MPSPKLREMEINLNKVFALYAKLYYSNPITSVYLWDLGERTIEDGFAVAILIKNNVTLEKDINDGSWDSSHLCTVKFGEGKDVSYTLISTIILQMAFNSGTCGSVNLSGNITKKVINLTNNTTIYY